MNEKLYIEGWQYDLNATFSFPKVALKCSDGIVTVVKLKDSAVIFENDVQEVTVAHTKRYLILSQRGGTRVEFSYNHPFVDWLKRALVPILLTIAGFSFVFIKNSEVTQATGGVFLLVAGFILTYRRFNINATVGYSPVTRVHGKKRKEVYNFFARQRATQSLDTPEAWQAPKEISSVDKKTVGALSSIFSTVFAVLPSVLIAAVPVSVIYTILDASLYASDVTYLRSNQAARYATIAALFTVFFVVFTILIRRVIMRWFLKETAKNLGVDEDRLR